MVTLHQQVNLVFSQPRCVFLMELMKLLPIFYLVELLIDLALLASHPFYSLRVVINCSTLPILCYRLFAPFIRIYVLIYLLMSQFRTLFVLFILQLIWFFWILQIFHILFFMYLTVFLSIYLQAQTFYNYYNKKFQKMFKQRQPFQPPVVPFVDKHAKRNMSIQQSQKIQKSVPKMKQNIILERQKSYDYVEELKSKKVKTGPSGTFDPINNNSQNTQFQMRFAFDLQNPVSQNQQQVYWNYTISNQVSGQYLRKLIFRQQEFFVRGIQQGGVVNSLSVSFDNVPGYFDSDGIQTNSLCVLQLAQQVPIIDDIGLKTYDLIYKQVQDVAWDIPMNVNQLKLRLSADGQTLSGPLAVPLTMLFDIRHVGK